MIADALIGLVKANLAGGAAVVAVLAARRWVRARFGARAAYALWLAPLAAAVAVLAPHPQVTTPVGSIVLSAAAAASDLADEFVAQMPGAVGATAAGQTPGAAALLFAAWLAGVLAALALVAWRQSRFTAAMGRLTPDDGLFRAESAAVGPAVVGIFRPRIVAPADFEARFAESERTLILAHEQVHLAGGDAAINALACALTCLCWFNPLAHLAVRALRIDQELACDAAVIGRFPGQRRAYAELLLKTQIVSQPLPLGCHWPPGAEHPLKERIAMLKCPLPARAARRVGAAVTLLACAGAAGLAWAASPSEPAANLRVERRVTDAPATSAAADDVRIDRRTTSVATPRPRPQAQDAPADRRVESLTTAEPKPARIPASYAPPPRAPVIVKPDWVQKPVPADVVAFYPKAALASHTEGRATMHCAVAASGELTGCQVVSEDPAGMGFGEAALAMAAKFRMKPMTQDGVATSGGQINIPIRFLLPASPAPEPGAANAAG